MGTDKKFRARVDGAYFDEVYDEVLKETASENIPMKEVYNRAERRIYERAKKLGIDLKQPYSDHSVYLECRAYRIKKHQQNAKNKRDHRELRQAGGTD